MQRMRNTDANYCRDDILDRCFTGVSGRAIERRPAAVPMLGNTGVDMKLVSKEKIEVLAEKSSWSLAHAEGYIDGENYRRRGTTPSKYAQIGIDEYCLGFRAGYYERKNPELMRPRKPVAPVTGC